MSVNAPQAHSKLTTKEMMKMFGPIIFFSILLPSIDIITDLRIIIRLYTQPINICKLDGSGSNITNDEYSNCIFSYDLSLFCKREPSLCKTEIKTINATLLLGIQV